MKKDKTKYIFVIGGVISGVGKGITTSSIGMILKSKGYRVNAVKIEQYINIDAGTMNPREHGEVFVTHFGDETDQDIGNYERFLEKNIKIDNFITTGRIFQSLIEKERNLEFNGKNVELIPHFPLEVIDKIKRVSSDSNSDIVLIEIGGTIGEYQILPYLEAARILKLEKPNDVLFIMVSYLPIPSKLGEMKTKPTQYAIKTLNSCGIFPNFVIARSKKNIDRIRREKISFNCNIPKQNVISAPDVESIYDIPLNFEKERIGERILKNLGLKNRKSDLEKWENFVLKTKNGNRELNIAIAGKYFDTGSFVLSDSYLSVIEAIKFSCYQLGVKPKISWINCKDFENNKMKIESLRKFDGIIVPGGFGSTGIKGKLKVIEFARKNKIPYLGLCYGMQLAIIEFARNVLGLKDANTHEIDCNSKNLVVDIMPEQREKIKNNDYGGTMRLGAYPAILKKRTIAFDSYKKNKIQERHRHRYEVNPKYIKKLEKKGIIFSGTSPNKKLMEIMELPRKIHPFFVATQFHPEFTAKPLSPHPLFTEFIKASLNTKNAKK
jgi:CTP synthase